MGKFTEGRYCGIIQGQTGCFSLALKFYLPGKPSQGLRREPFLDQLAKSKIAPACLASRVPGMLTSANENE